MSTTHTPTITLRLSCGHTVPFEDDPRNEVNAGNIAEGTPIGCEKCPRRKGGSLSVRRVKAVTIVERQTADEVTDEPRPSEAAMAAVEAAEQADVVDEAEAAARSDAAVVARADDPKPEAKRGPRVVAASREAKALKAWTEGGEQGPRPVTVNLDAIEAENAARGDHGPDQASKAKTAKSDAANPVNLGLPQGKVGMVDAGDMTPDDTTATKRTRQRKPADTPDGSKVTDLNLSAPRRAVMLEALPEEPDGEVQDVASVVALRTKVAAGADRVDVDAAGVRALLTGLAPMCAAGNKAACRLNDWLAKFADEVGYKPAEA